MGRPRQFRRDLRNRFWSLYGHAVWDEQKEPSSVSEPPEHVAEILQKQGAAPDDRILDAGCGTGNYAIALAQAGFRVVGVDLAPGMLARARRKIAADLNDRVVFQQADLNCPLEFPPDCFEHIICISVLQAVEDPMMTLGELQRVLRPGGILLLSLPKHNSRVVTDSVCEVIRFRVRHLKRRTPGKVVLIALKSLADRYSCTRRWTGPEARRMLNANRFRTIRIDEGRQIVVVAEKIAA